MAEEEDKKEVKWDMWQKKRIFIREVSGKYADIYKNLLEQPRVYKSKQKPYKGGPVQYHKRMIDPQFASVIQTIESHIDIIMPGAYGQKHGHMNSAVFFILEGKGYDIHDTVRYDWEAGDACIVENGCVHQHFNGGTDRPVHAIVFKAKPLFLFFNLLFQKNVEFAPNDPIPGWENFNPNE